MLLKSTLVLIAAALIIVAACASQTAVPPTSAPQATALAAPAPAVTTSPAVPTAAAAGQPTSAAATQPTVASATTVVPPATAKPVSALDGVALLNQRCAGCHNLDRVKAAKKDAATWKATVERMMGKGAQLTPAELDALVKYLAETYK